MKNISIAIFYPILIGSLFADIIYGDWALFLADIGVSLMFMAYHRSEIQEEQDLNYNQKHNIDGRSTKLKLI